MWVLKDGGLWVDPWEKGRDGRKVCESRGDLGLASWSLQSLRRKQHVELPHNRALGPS